MTIDRFKPLLDRSFLRGALEYEFQDYVSNGQDAPLLERLNDWLKRELTMETKAQESFTQRFFVETWGYRQDGTGSPTFHLEPQFEIAGAGQTGGKGKADLGIGLFGDGRPKIPQIVCEFKDIRSGLDNKQNRKGNNRSPVQQAQDYLWGARRGVALNAPVQPRFAIVTDMNEFRLYWSEDMPERYVRFKVGNLKQQLEFDDIPALAEGTSEEAQFDRFLFWYLFQPAMLLSDAGRTRLERLVERQGKIEKKLEDDFYDDYRNYREALINYITVHKPVEMTKSGAVRLGQKLLDRFIFIMFAEDMGGRVGFPANALQEELKDRSRSKFLEPNGLEIWELLKQIFRVMNDGGELGDADIHQFNGGLFAPDSAIDALTLPNRLFAIRGQSQNDAKLAEHKKTLFYLAATYNFAKEGDAKNSIGLYTLGHIFEQSIVELEKLEADADDRLSLTDVTKRKRDGVYYTPEWAVRRIIEETIEPLFTKWKAGAGWANDGLPTKEAAANYWERLQKIKVIDPACGSGAFLIVALRYLQREFELAADYALATKAISKRPSEAEITEMILVNNLFGVDINPASVEITRLSLWLHTAQANKPLSSLDSHIACGNSLIDSRFYDKRKLYDEEEKDRINTFDWQGDFATGSFDAVIGNPPYVKLQNFVKVHADMAAWLVSNASGYESTSTGNFDLYLPFIEKGLALLNGGGRMGYIAPNLWPTLEYGEGLRGLIHKGRHLEKWLDFRSFQVFEEATVYTAIQIFSKASVDEIRLAFAGDGDISRVAWTDADHVLPYDAIALPLKPWLVAPVPVRTLIERLGRKGTPLGHSENTTSIFQGLVTSADHIYHLRRIGKGRFAYTPRLNGKKQAEVVVEIEDAIMKPLISGADAKRFLEPQTDIYLLFPYRVDDSGAKLFTPDEMASDFPNAWKFLRLHEKELRKRDSGKNNNDEKWFGYIYPKNLDKQELPKLLVPRLVSNLGCFVDDKGKYYCDNVDVGGVVASQKSDLWFLAGVLNSPVTNVIFGWLTKPFRGDYKAANKQFIAPLPVPSVERKDRAGLSQLAQKLQQDSSERIDLLAQLAELLAKTVRPLLPLEQVLDDVESIPQIELKIPKSVPLANRKAWVDYERKAQEEAAFARLDGLIRLDSEMTVTLAKGKLSLLIDEQEAAKLFVQAAEAELIAAQWRCISLDFAPTGKGDGKRVIDRLRKVAKTADPAVTEQIIFIGEALATLSDTLREDEAQLHELTCTLFNLTADERALVDASRGRR
ncbi:MAG: Eco57I restriction-modification methylase domain-containing protein [Sphingomonadaceae bacterium]|nr:Eco57I restriction-modification methylase domain-containing protein [Sphingomonadaceae bacterium]